MTDNISTTLTAINITISDEAQLTVITKLLVDARFSFLAELANKEINISEFIDARNLPCPQPLLRVKRTLRNMTESSSLYLVATDENAKLDIQAYSNHANVEVLIATDNNNIDHFLLTLDPSSK